MLRALLLANGLLLALCGFVALAYVDRPPGYVVAIGSWVGAIVLCTAAVAAQDSGAPIDLVDVFRAPQFAPAIVNECIRLKLPAIWLQDGVVHDDAALRAQAAGLFTVMDRCIYRDRAMLAAS